MHQPSFKNGTIFFRNNETIRLYCPGGYLTVNSQSINRNVANAICSGGIQFKLEGISKTVPFDAIDCTTFPVHVARYANKTCSNNKTNQLIEVGFDLKPGFIVNYAVCFDTVLQRALYSTSNMSSMIARMELVQRPQFVQGQFFNVGNKSVNSLYVQNVQRSTINKLLGLSNNNYTYIHKNDSFFLSRGHLTAKADFIYGSQQRSTFYYVNAAPQWQIFNEGNWNALENSVRSFVAGRNSDVVIYTGTHGIAKLPNLKGVQTELYLYATNKAKGIPVPELYWKVVYDPKTKAGTAFVGVNNPYIKNHNKICLKDVCSQIKWIHWRQNNITEGYSYCCSVDDFRRTVKNLPMFNVSGLLK